MTPRKPRGRLELRFVLYSRPRTAPDVSKLAKVLLSIVLAEQSSSSQETSSAEGDRHDA